MEPLMSQRYVPLHYHPPRPKSNNIVNSLVLMDKTPVKQPAHMVRLTPKHPFRLLDLPVEMQRLVYEQYFGHWEVTLDYERLTMLKSKFHIQGVPPLDLLLSCRSVYREARDVRLATFNGRLKLNSVFILVPIRRKERFEWLRRNVTTLHFSDSSVHPERWNRYYDNFPNLQRLEIEFPHVVRLDARCRSLKEVLDGLHDDILLESLDTFRLTLVDQLSDMVQVTVSQRYCMREEIGVGVGVGAWNGILNVQIRLASTSTRIIARDHDTGVSVVSKRQFRRPYEL